MGWALCTQNWLFPDAGRSQILSPRVVTVIFKAPHSAPRRAQEDDKPWIKSPWEHRENPAEGQWQSLGECPRKGVIEGMATGQKVLKDQQRQMGGNGGLWGTN